MEKVSDKIDVHTLRSAELQIFWAIDSLSTSSKDRFLIEEILNYLIEEVGINLALKTAEKALARAGNEIHKNKYGYKLMEQAKKNLGKNIDTSVIVIEPGKPFSTKTTLVASIMSTLQGEIKICDPYMDSFTLDFLSKWIAPGVVIKIITEKIVEKTTGMFRRNLVELTKEGHNIEVRILEKNLLHDRYIIDDKKMWHSGNSFNHLGQKESYIIKLGEDIRQSSKSLFDSRWKTATCYR